MTAENPPRAFPLSVPDPLEPAPEYATLRESEPVAPLTLPTGHRAWVVTRYDDVRLVLADPRFSKSALTAPDAPRLLPVAKGSKSLFTMDPPEHTRLRKLVTKAFTVRHMEQLRPRVQKITDELLDGMAADGPPADLIAHLAQPLPITVICEMLGVPLADQERFRVWSDVMLSISAHSPDDVMAARTGLNSYLGELIAAKAAAPADDLLTQLIEAREEGDRLSEEELLAFGHTLLVAGYHATTGEVVGALITLLRKPGLWERLRADHDLVPSAVEELLRYSVAGGGAGAMRIATEDVELGGALVRKGEAVLPAITSANRDGRVFADPEEVDLDRESNPHLTFGHGLHHCLGAQLGRIELQVALRSLLERFPELRLAVAADELKWVAGMAFRRPLELPVAW
ncbi:cytochrome P450 [Streptomyces sp. NBC_01618]|uniref:cytochrome P450 n=1 Tax=Streptomyces sp. NBC_01618 TaxID=2975900 RepID=UPI003870B728|nr:cytochrome P450 [Streptomyces sp. NBC_01618]